MIAIFRADNGNKNFFSICTVIYSNYDGKSPIIFLSEAREHTAACAALADELEV